MLCILAALSLSPLQSAHANWLTSLTKTAGKAAGDVPHLGALGKAAGHLADLPPGARGLAAHATPEGHWQFANREGQLFTAGTADEMKRVVTTLAPDAAGQGKLSLYLSEDSVFANRIHLDKLPKEADLHLVTPHGALPVVRGGAGELSVKLKPNVSLALRERASFSEAMSFLSRPLNKSNIRTIAIAPDGKKALPSAPRLDPVSKAPLVDELDPGNIAGAFASMRGQTALMVGRIDGAKITFHPGSGGEITRNLDELLGAARDSDVNLVLLHAETPRQPGGRNWLWQRIEVGGLDDALAKATFGDFLDALGARRSPMSVSASLEDAGRVRISALPNEAGGPVEAVQSTWGELFSDVTGEIATRSLDVYARDDARQTELDGRIIPGVPTYIQVPYLISVLCGLLAWGVSRAWWRFIWPPSPRRDGQGALRHFIANTPNFLVYLLLFLPFAGGFAFLWHVMLQAWAAITAPFRWIAKLFRRAEV